jgi:coenzyme F420-reducing hydrogenase delta subunit
MNVKKKNDTKNDKTIVALCCENSSYKAASSVTDTDVLEDVRIVPLPCSGKTEIDLVLQFLEAGYEGVLVLGCPKDNCMFMRGSARAEKRVDKIRETLGEIGIDENRVRMEFLSSLDTHKFVRAVREMKEYVAETAETAKAAGSGGAKKG